MFNKMICKTIDFKEKMQYYNCRRKLLKEHTCKNDALIVCETEAVMECGDCGDYAKGGNLPYTI